MSKNSKDTAGLTLAERIEGSLNGFFGRNKKTLIVVAIIVIVGLATLGIVLSVSQNNLQEQFNEIDQLEASYVELQAMGSDNEAYQETYDELVASLTDLAGKSSKYPSQKAEYLLGMIAFQDEAYQKAIDSFLSVYSNADGSYLGSLALANAAAAAEELGNDSLALEYYTKIIDEFGFTAAESPKALFGQARLQEKSGNTELAKATFQQLADQFPTSEFAKLAINRVALL
ncbi:tetratricopeptide repeat protein [Sphaerochaeta halotolerans]|uniref:tetratricopeptide repeat protein n=1 Tax=Sphaerochaeta halotolerans TaxID=2293840 RepID=UPI001370F500|nr:tetratricopeptide repeat protein [Sphaerochaeta halotolerans]MXI86207.1 tetratricopeptide repeat protein [Sphaerochaeta halotolerans]